jgi:seryl-tRNA synthetase
VCPSEELTWARIVVERGGNPDKIKESQRKRHAPEEAVDEVIAMFEDHRKSRLASTPRCPL